jgi:hypothetical protein
MAIYFEGVAANSFMNELSAIIKKNTKPSHEITFGYHDVLI